ncbi:hypothetical protein BY458DRAFT_445928 [Sporodiniella umbellata]|nr:hypothetical protein BY458DRAFT_445928 [Sporodiniella umbellata]
MYSGQEFIDNQQNLFINNNSSSMQRNNLTQPTYHPLHSRNANGSGFAPLAVPSAMVQGMHTDSSSSWFGTSLDSNTSSFGGRDLVITPSSSTGRIADGYSHSNDDDDFNQRGHQEVFEKKRRRRESHNAVERRRRDNINERIQESVPISSNFITVTTGQSGVNGKAINKGTILKLSVEYIKELRDQVLGCKNRAKELEHLIEMAQQNNSNPQLLGNQHYSRKPMLEHAKPMSFQHNFDKLHSTSLPSNN